MPPTPRSRPQPQDHLKPQPKQPKPFDLDALEKDGGAPPPFVAVIGGREFTFANLQDLDWQDSEDIRTKQDGRQAMHAMLGDEQWQAFLALPAGTVPDWKLSILAETVTEHYATGEDNASRT